MYLVSLQSCHPLGTKDFWLRPHHLSSQHTNISLEITGQNLEQTEV
jgi:hypothetical protein